MEDYTPGSTEPAGWVRRLPGLPQCTCDGKGHHHDPHPRFNHSSPASSLRARLSGETDLEAGFTASQNRQPGYPYSSIKLSVV